MGVKTDERRFEPGFVALVTQLNKAIHRRSSEELLGMRLKPYMTLGYIRDHPVVLLLNELETARYVVRRRDPQDRRRHIVELTTAGSHALERADRAREGLEDEVLSGISSEERKTLRRLLERILDSLLQPASEARA